MRFDLVLSCTQSSSHIHSLETPALHVSAAKVGKFVDTLRAASRICSAALIDLGKIDPCRRDIWRPPQAVANPKKEHIFDDLM